MEVLSETTISDGMGAVNRFCVLELAAEDIDGQVAFWRRIIV